MQLLHRRGAQDDLVLVLHTVPAQDGRGDRVARVGLRVLKEERNGLPVDVGVVVVIAGPRRHVVITAQQRLGLGRDGVGRIEHVRPVPSVERRMRHQGLQTTPERERGDHECHRQHRAQQRGAHRDSGAAVTGLEGETHADRSRRGQTRRGHGVHGPRRHAGIDLPGAGPRGGGRPGRRARARWHRARRSTLPVRCRAPSSRRRGPNPGRQAEPGRAVTAVTRRPPTTAATSAPTTTAPIVPIRPSAIVAAGAAPRARSTLRSSSAACSCREMTWTPMSSAARADTMPEHAQCDGERLDGAVHLGLDRSDGVEGGGRARRDQIGELPLHPGDAGVPAVDLQPVGDGAALALAPVGHDLLAQGGREEDERGEPVDVVLHQGVAHLHEPDQCGIDPCDGAAPWPCRIPGNPSCCWV